MKKIILFLFLLVLFLSMISHALADEQNLVVIQRDEPGTLLRACILENSEIWINGKSQTQDGYAKWLARVNPDGTVVHYVDAQYATDFIFYLRGTPCVLLYVQDENDPYKAKSELVPILENGSAGNLIALNPDAGNSIAGYFSPGLLQYNNSLENPWLTFYDKNLNIVMTVDNPFDFAPEIYKQGYPLSFCRALWTPEGVLLFGQLEMGKAYLMRAVHGGTVESFITIQFPPSRNVMDMAIWNDQVFVLGKTMSGEVGATYLTCMDFHGKIAWEQVITDYHKGVTFHRIEQVGSGFILSGDRMVKTPRGTESTIFFATVAHDGRIGKEMEISYIRGGMLPSNILFGEDFYVFGNGIGNLDGHVVFEKFSIDDSWFPDSDIR